MYHSVGNEHQSINLYLFSYLAWYRFFSIPTRTIEFPLLISMYQNRDQFPDSSFSRKDGICMHAKKTKKLIF